MKRLCSIYIYNAYLNSPAFLGCPFKNRHCAIVIYKAFPIQEIKCLLVFLHYRSSLSHRCSFGIQSIWKDLMHLLRRSNFQHSRQCRGYLCPEAFCRQVYCRSLQFSCLRSNLFLQGFPSLMSQEGQSLCLRRDRSYP